MDEGDMQRAERIANQLAAAKRERERAEQERKEREAREKDQGSS